VCLLPETQTVIVPSPVEDFCHCLDEEEKDEQQAGMSVQRQYAI
jgi:hypothetical protein